MPRRRKPFKRQPPRRRPPRRPAPRREPEAPSPTYLPPAPPAQEEKAGTKRPRQIDNPGSRGQDSLYDVRGLPEVRPGVFSDGIYEYDANGLSLNRPSTVVT